MTTIMNHQVEILDGGTGEELQRVGLPDDRKVWSARALVDPQYHSLLKSVHKSFIKAGSQYITTNNYAVTPNCGFGDSIEQWTSLAGKLAVEARDECVQEGYPKAKICGCLPPLGESYRPDRLLTKEASLDCYRRVVNSLEPFVDLFLAETMSCVLEASWAFQSITSVNKDKPVWVSWTVQSDGCLRSGEPPTEAIRSLLKLDGAEQRLKMISFNCSEPESITLTLKTIYGDQGLTSQLQRLNIRLGAYANRLVPVQKDFEMKANESAAPTRAEITEQVYTNFATEWVKMGVHYIGGCCGITPSHIEHLAQSFVKRE